MPICEILSIFKAQWFKIKYTKKSQTFVPFYKGGFIRKNQIRAPKNYIQDSRSSINSHGSYWRSWVRGRWRRTSARLRRCRRKFRRVCGTRCCSRTCAAFDVSLKLSQLKMRQHFGEPETTNEPLVFEPFNRRFTLGIKKVLVQVFLIILFTWKTVRIYKLCFP